MSPPRHNFIENNLPKITAYQKHSGTSITFFQIDFFAFIFCFPTGSYRCSDVVSINVQLTIQTCMGNLPPLYTGTLWTQKKPGTVRCRTNRHYVKKNNGVVGFPKDRKIIRLSPNMPSCESFGTLVIIASLTFPSLRSNYSHNHIISIHWVLSTQTSCAIAIVIIAFSLWKIIYGTV